MNNTELFERIKMIIDENINASNEKELWEIADALHSLIEINRREYNLSSLKIKIIAHMALCNYKIGNTQLAYNCALIAKGLIEKYDNKHEILSQLDIIDDLLKTIRNEISPSKLSTYELYEEFVLGEYNTLNIRKRYPLCQSTPFSKEKIYSLIDALKQLASLYYKRASVDGRWQEAEKSVQYVNIFKYPLLYVWQKYGFGCDDDVWDEDEDMMPYQMFVGQIRNILPELIMMLNTESPFAQVGLGHDNITRDLLLILNDLYMRLRKNML